MCWKYLVKIDFCTCGKRYFFLKNIKNILKGKFARVNLQAGDCLQIYWLARVVCFYLFKISQSEKRCR